MNDSEAVLQASTCAPS